MRIALIIPINISGRTNGVRIQAQTWANGLKTFGHSVELVDPWGDYDWDRYDIVHVFGYGPHLEIVRALSLLSRSRIILSPIIDSTRSFLAQNLASRLSIPMLHMHSPLNYMRRCEKHVSMYLARSCYEKCYITRSFGISVSRVKVVKIPSRFSENHNNDCKKKKKFCLHVSILSSKNKNVLRLVAAAIKYKFELVLVGKITDSNFGSYLTQLCQKEKNITIFGYVSDKELRDLFSQASVFALPSIYEGVGLVALEAASFGADIVLTKQGGPKEYYDGMAFLVDPLDVDNIGKTIVSVLDGRTKQPELQRHIRGNLSSKRSAADLLDVYQSVIYTNPPNH